MTEQDDTPEKCANCGDELFPVDRVTHRAIVDTLKAEIAQGLEREKHYRNETSDIDDQRAAVKRKLSLLQAVAALDVYFGYALTVGTVDIYHCRGCQVEWHTNPHADGCPVGRYEEGK